MRSDSRIPVKPISPGATARIVVAAIPTQYPMAPSIMTFQKHYFQNASARQWSLLTKPSQSVSRYSNAELSSRHCYFLRTRFFLMPDQLDRFFQRNAANHRDDTLAA